MRHTGKSLKVWRTEKADALGISESAFRMRLYRKKIAYPKVKRVNPRVVYVIEDPSN